MSTNARRGGNGCLIAAMLGGVGLVIAGIAIETIELATEADETSASPPSAFEGSAAPPPSAPPARAPMSPAPPSAFGPSVEPLPILWSAESLSDGTPCVLAVHVARGRNEIVAQSAALYCGEALVASGAVERAVLHEVPRGDGAYTYRASLIAGALTVRSGERRLEANGASYLLDDLSAPRRWAPFLDANAALVARVRERLVRRAVPAQTSGPIPEGIAEALRGGPQCELVGDATPLDQVAGCRLLLRCGDTIIYGAGDSGYVWCTVADGRIDTADDPAETYTDTDPRIHLDAREGILDVWDTHEGGSYWARFRLEQDPRCSLEGTWRGWARDAEGRQLSFALDARGPIPRMRWTGGDFDGTTELLRATPHCERGELELAVVGLTSAIYHLRLGAGMRSLVGTRDSSRRGATRLRDPELVLWARRD